LQRDGSIDSAEFNQLLTKNLRADAMTDQIFFCSLHELASVWCLKLAKSGKLNEQSGLTSGKPSQKPRETL
jgi:hypothetical protein